MLKILIADDEPKVCKLIVKLIETSDVDSQIVGIVHDGISALEFLKEHQVDLLLTDIRMPGYTGLELIRNIVGAKKDIKIIIISGYGQFDYAQQAIKYGVNDYLLKPIKKVELNSALNKIARQLEKQQKQEAERHYMIEQITKDDKREKEELFRRYLERPNEFGERECEELFRDILGKDVKYQAVIIRMLSAQEKSENRNLMRQILFKGSEIVQDNLQKDGRRVLMAVKGSDIYCVMSGNEEQLDQGAAYLKKIKVDLMKLSEIFSEIKAWAAIGKRISVVGDVSASILSAEEALLGRFINKNSEILTVQDSVSEPVEKDFEWNMEKERFLNSMEVLDIDWIQKELKRLQDRMNSAQNLTGIQIKKIYLNIITTFQFGLHRFGIELTSREECSPEQMFKQSSTVEELFAKLNYYIVDGLRAWEGQRNLNGGEKKYVLKAKQYINEFYYMPLTLEEVSDYVGFNASYFSSIFKKEMNQSFSEYLTEIRIRYAKQMILNENIGITEVSERVGYNDKKYFAKVFKKNTGLTPYEFKKIYQ